MPKVVFKVRYYAPSDAYLDVQSGLIKELVINGK